MGRSDIHKGNKMDLRRKNKTDKSRKKKAITKSYFHPKHEPNNDELSSDSSQGVSNSADHLRPIGDYVNNRREMVAQMFNSIRGRHLNLILPDVLKDVPLAELQRLCVDQLEVMSKKRIRFILAGKEMTSSSGTDDSDESDPESEAENQNEPRSSLERRSESVQSEMPQPDSTSVDQLLLQEIVKETIESDEDFTEVIVEKAKPNEAEIVPHKARSPTNSLFGSVELEEPAFNIVFDSSDDDLRARVLSKRTAVNFNSDENEKENELDSGVKINQRKILMGKKQNNSSSKECSSSPQSCLDENLSCEKNDLSRSNLKEKSISSDVSDQQKRTRSSTHDEDSSEYDGDSELEDGEIRTVKRKRFKRKKLKPLNVQLDVSDQNCDRSSSDRQPDDVDVDCIAQVDCDEVPHQPDDLMMCESTKGNDDQNSTKYLEENLNLPFENDDDEPLDVDLRTKDDAWSQYDNDLLCGSNKNDDQQVIRTKENLKFIDSVSQNEVSTILCNDIRPKPPPGVVVDDVESNDLDFEHYESDDDSHMDFVNLDQLMPPGLEHPVEHSKLIPNDNVCDSCEPSTSGVESAPQRKTSIVPIKTLYKQLKAQREMKKVKPKIYGAQLPSWSIQTPAESAGPQLHSAEESRPISRVSFDEPAKNANIDVGDDLEVSSSSKKIKKKSKVLTQEFLDELEKQKKEHKNEMNRKEAKLEKLKEKRLAVVQKEKETEEKLKKQIDLGFHCSNDDNIAVVDDELLLFDDDQSSFIFTDDDATTKVDWGDHEEGEYSGDDAVLPPKIENNQSFKSNDLKSFSICLNEEGSRCVKINEKAEKMKSAFSLEDEKRDDKAAFGTYRRSRSTSRQRSSRSNGSRHDDTRRRDRSPIVDRYEKRDQSFEFAYHHRYERRSKERDHRRDDRDQRVRKSRTKSISDHRLLESTKKDKTKRKSAKTKRETCAKVSSSIEKRNETVEDAKNLKTTSTTTTKQRIAVVESKPNVNVDAGDKEKITVQKLELYELEMRARAIRALMKKQELEKNK